MSLSPEQGIDGYGGKDFEKMQVLRREWKMIRLNKIYDLITVIAHK